MNADVLILSSVYDFSTDYVVECMRNRGVQCARINKEELKSLNIAMEPCEPTLSVFFGETQYTITTETRSIFFRQPVFLRNTPGSALSLEEQLERSQWSAFLRSLSVFQHARWMNWPQATYLAECKPFQLSSAYKAGFLTPRTVVSNSPVLAERQIPGDFMAVKSLDTILLREGSDCLFSYTQILAKDELKNEECQSAPVTFQEYISDKIDIRATVIGECVFCVEILENDHGIEGDWRLRPREVISYRDHLLPCDIEKKCIEFVRKLGLSFGAIDFALKGDEYYFIEINPTGEWGWLTGQDRPIHETITDYLIGN